VVIIKAKKKIKKYGGPTRLSKGAKVLITIVLILELAALALVIAISKDPYLLTGYSEAEEAIVEEEVIEPVVEEVPVVEDIYTMDYALVTTEELDALDSEGTYLMLNEIYARNGFIFGSTNLQAHFDSQEWYEGYTSDMDEVYSNMTYTEQQNIEIIVEYQKEHGYR